MVRGCWRAGDAGGACEECLGDAGEGETVSAERGM